MTLVMGFLFFLNIKQKKKKYKDLPRLTENYKREMRNESTNEKKAQRRNRETKEKGRIEAE